MSYYFVRATSNYGPVNFAVFTDCHSRDRYTISAAIGLEAARRGIVACTDWTAEPIDLYTYRQLS